ncbi:glycosyl transferase, group 2 [Nitratiruptor sp. YY09-18]|nr:glycosyltransferase family 2 protein [Nitratiruptor sp. YY09-18]BCD68368.1 glycosyl transferase, group 2 [Nitratiruptor sp. YY09-18]
MKNEEENLPRLLKSLQGKFDEIIVVDTGSTDRSIEIAKEYGCKVYEKEWNGFADARNYAISKCEGEWIWHFDADFELEDKEFEKFQKFLLHWERSKNKEEIKVVGVHIKNFGFDGVVKAVSTQAFIHRNVSEIFWTGKIHEQLNTKMSLLLPVYVNHFGYQDENVQKQKALRNLELLLHDIVTIKDKNKRFDRLFYILQSYAILTHFDPSLSKEAQKFIAKFLVMKDEVTEDSLEFMKIYGLYYITLIYMQSGKFQQALELLQNSQDYFEKIPDLIVIYIQLLYKTKKKELAKKYFLKAAKVLGTLHIQKNTAIIDKINDFYQMSQNRCFELFTDEDIPVIWQKWKKEKTLFFGLLLLSLYEKYKNEKYEKFLDKLIKIFHNEIFLIKKLHIYLEKKEWEKAKKMAMNLLHSNPHSCKAKEILGVVAIHEQNYSEAIRYFMDVVQMCKNSAGLQNLLVAIDEGGYQKESEKIRHLLKK